MSERPRVSVLMGVKNGGELLDPAITSVLEQTLEEIEVLVVDDGSTDETAAKLSAIDDPRLVVLTNDENIGLTRSLNRAFAASRGEFVARQDADDRSLPQRFVRQLEFMRDHPDVGICGTWTRLVDGDGNVVGRGHNPSSPDEMERGMWVDNKMFHGTLFARREVMERLGGYREAFRYSQDYDLLLRALDSTRLANVPEELYEFRFHAGSLSSTTTELQFRYRLLALHLARTRRGSGMDDLERGVPVERLLEAVTSDTPEYWAYQAMYRRLSGDLRGYRRALMRVIRLDPRSASTYAQLLLSAGGRPLLAAADALVRRLHPASASSGSRDAISGAGDP